ncbi:hypothetical protein I316_06801 [Kwoniella heveanensis BCC8398]|uniref:Beta-lactamase-related domain-containing protein n=1 Tax=Kwoniella heveanensis BCC8398 TaxID=1296120 RepID=A0A1B9GKG1_9TREE|nr:hypothetical protein I316_06801 [Kwoniella heveanensis BCC8398]
MSDRIKAQTPVDKDLRVKQSDAILPDEMIASILQAMGQWHIPDLRLAIVKEQPGHDDASAEPVAFSIALGENSDYDVKMPLGSNSKLFALSALDKVLSANGYDVDTPIKKILPDFQLANPQATELCSCRDIATHMTGLPDYDKVVEPGLTAKDLTERLRCLPPTAPFRSRFQYCNISSAILIQIIEHLSGRSYADYATDEILMPLKMKFTSFQPDDKLSMGHFNMVGADGEEKGSMDLEFAFAKSSGIEAAGGVLTVGRDLLKWLLAVPNFPIYDTAPSPTVTENVPYPLHPPSRASYGLYLTQASYYNLNTIEHIGNTNSHSSLIVFPPDLKVRFGVMFNVGDYETGHAFTSWIRATLLDRFAGFEPKDWLSEIQVVAAKEQQKLARHFGAIESDPNLPPLVGTFKCPGFATWDLNEINNVSVRPELITIPGFEKLYGSTQVLVAAVQGSQIGQQGEGWYVGCLQLNFEGGVNDGRVMHGSPFKAQLCEEGKKLHVYWLVEGDLAESPTTFTKAGNEDC